MDFDSGPPIGGFGFDGIGRPDPEHDQTGGKSGSNGRKDKRFEPNNLDPGEPDYVPWEDPDGEGWKFGVDDDYDDEIAVDSVECDFTETFNILAVKFLWDLIMSTMRPTEDAIKSILSQMVSVGTKDVLAQYHVDKLDDRAVKLLLKAQEAATRRFVALYGSPMLTPEFLRVTREALRKGLRKQK